MLCAVAFSNDILPAGELNISEIQAEAIAGKIAIGVECDGITYGVDIPDAAVVVKVQDQIGAGTARNTENGNHIVVTLAADDGVSLWHFGRRSFRDDWASCPSGIEGFCSCRCSSAVRGRSGTESARAVTHNILGVSVRSKKQDCEEDQRETT